MTLTWGIEMEELVGETLESGAAIWLELSDTGQDGVDLHVPTLDKFKVDLISDGGVRRRLVQSDSVLLGVGEIIVIKPTASEWSIAWQLGRVMRCREPQPQDSQPQAKRARADHGAD